MLLHQLTRKAVQTAKRGTPYGPFASIATGGPFPFPECSTEHRTYLLSKLRSALGQASIMSICGPLHIST